MLQVCMFCCFNESNVHHLFEQSKAAQVKIVPQGFLGCAMPYFRKDKQVRFAYNLHTFHSPSAPTLPLASPRSSPTTSPSTSHGLPRPPYNTPYYSPSIPRPHSLLEAAAVSWDLMG